MLETGPRGLTREGPYSSDGRWAGGGFGGVEGGAAILVSTILSIYLLSTEQFHEILVK